MNTPNQPAGTIDGAALLNEVEAFHRRFNVFPREAAYVAVALWDAHAHLLDAFDSTPPPRLPLARTRIGGSPARWRWWRPWSRAPCSP